MRLFEGLSLTSVVGLCDRPEQGFFFEPHCCQGIHHKLEAHFFLNELNVEERNGAHCACYRAYRLFGLG